MLNNNLLVVSLLCLVAVASVVVNAQVDPDNIYWPVNGHYYYYVPLMHPQPYWMALQTASRSTYTDPITGIVLQGYLATVTSNDEFDFITKGMFPGSPYGPPGQTNSWIAGMRSPTNKDLWTYNQGPEAGQQLFQRSTGRCNGFCAFNTRTSDSPSYDEDVLYVLRESTTFSLSATNQTEKYSRGFWIEYGGLEAPFVPTVPTTAGPITITKLSGYDVSQLHVTITPGTGSSYTCPKVSSTATTYTCNLNAGSGNSSTITITDGANTYTTRLPFLQAYIETLYPPTTSANIITLVGENFGTSASHIIILTGPTQVPCTNVVMIASQTIVSCHLAATPSPTAQLLPITVNVNGNISPLNTRMAFYDANNLQMIRISPAAEFYNQALIMIAAGQNLEGAVPYTSAIAKNQASFILSTYNFIKYANYVFTGLIYNSNGAQGAGFYYNHPNSPNYNQIAIYKNTTCIPTIDCNYDGIYNGSVATWATGYTICLSVDVPPRFLVNGGSRSTGDIQGELIFYGQTPKLVPAVPAVALFNTSGGELTLNVTFNGFRYTKLGYSINGVAQSATVAKVASSLVSLDIPSGSGATPNSIAVKLETYTLNGATFAYYAPYLTSVSSLTSTSGGKITIHGLNLNNVASEITVTVGDYACTTVAIVTAHTKISCHLPQGSGSNLPITVNVNGQTQTNSLTFSYPTPTISSVTQNNFDVTVVGQNFGVDANVIVANLPVPLAPESLDGNTLVFVVPADSENGGFSITVGGLVSNTIQIKYKPLVLAVSGSSGPITVSGAFLNGVRRNGTPTTITVTAGPVSCTNVVATGTSLTCNLGSGAGNQNLIVTIDSVASNPFAINSVAPAITSIQQSGQTMTIFGANFGSSVSAIQIKFDQNPATVPPKVLSNPSRIIVTIPSFAKNGPVSLTVANVASNAYQFALTPLLNAVPAVPQAGGIVTVTGSFLNDVTYDGTALNTLVEANDEAVTGSEFLSTSIVVPFPAGTGSGSLSVTIGNLNANVPFNYDVMSVKKNLKSQQQHNEANQSSSIRASILMMVITFIAAIMITL
eukprot:gene2924-3363_t